MQRGCIEARRRRGQLQLYISRSKEIQKTTLGKVLEIGTCNDSVTAMWGAAFEIPIAKSHSKRVSKNGNGELNAAALRAVKHWHGYNLTWGTFAYPRIMSAHSKRILRVGNASDNVTALNEVSRPKGLWKPHWDKLLEIGPPHHFILVMLAIQDSSNGSDIYGGNRSELLKLSAEQILRRGFAQENIDAMRGIFYQNHRDAFSNRVVEIGNEGQNKEALSFCAEHLKESHAKRAQELQKNPRPVHQDRILLRDEPLVRKSPQSSVTSRKSS